VPDRSIPATAVRHEEKPHPSAAGQIFDREWKKGSVLYLDPLLTLLSPTRRHSMERQDEVGIRSMSSRKIYGGEYHDYSIHHDRPFPYFNRLHTLSDPHAYPSVHGTRHNENRPTTFRGQTTFSSQWESQKRTIRLRRTHAARQYLTSVHHADRCAFATDGWRFVIGDVIAAGFGDHGRAFRRSKPMADSYTPSQECSDTSDGFG
jgi:hypothetical protein